MQSPAPPFAAAQVIYLTRDVGHVVDPRQVDFWVGLVARRDANLPDTEYPFDWPLGERDIVDVYQFDPVGTTPQQTSLVDEPLCSELVIRNSI